MALKVQWVGGKKASVLQPTIAALVDNSGGVAVDGTIAAVSSSATAADAIKELATQVEAIRAAIKAAGIIL